MVGRKLPKELQKEIAQIQTEFWEGKPKNTIIEALTQMTMDLKEEIIRRQKGIITGGLYIAMPASRVMCE